MLNIQLQFVDNSKEMTKKIQNFAHNANAQILVGFLSGKQHVETVHKDPKTGEYIPPKRQWENAELAKMLSFGTATIPARPFLEDGIVAERDSIEKEIKNQLDAIKSEKGANWDKVGTMAVGAVQSFVRGDTYKATIPNSPETIARKGSDTPLIDGADLINSVEYVIEG